METKQKSKSILFILVLSLICLSLVYGVDVDNSLAEAESAIEIQPQEIKKLPFPPPTAGPEYAPDEILVKFKPGVKRSLMAEIHARFGMVKIREIERIGVHRLRIPPGRTVPEMVEEYRRNPNVEYAEPNYVARKYAVPNDPYYTNQWAFYQPSDADIDAQEAWDIEKGSSTIIIAIIDDGIDYNHEEFPSGKLWINPSTGKPGYDYGVLDDDVMHESGSGHGTCTAGIASAATYNGLGVAGTSWNATIMPLKVEDEGGIIYHSYMADAITFAADNGAHILSMSLGGPTSSTLEDACDYAWNTKDKVVLASSGNENTSVSYPAAYSTTIAVGATNESDERCTPVDWGGGQGSNYGPELDVVVPGNNIYAPDWSGTNGYVSGDYIADFGGTSASCPMAAGLAALILSQNPGLTNVQVRDLLRSTAEDLVGNPSEDTEGFDNYYGYGRINAYYALLGSPPPISKIVFTTPPRSTPVDSPSEVMTIQTQDSIGSPIAVPSDTAISLISTSVAGKFSLNASPWSDTSSLIISKGKKSASFYYKDSTVGTPTITASESPDAGWTDATQQENIVPLPDLTLIGSQDIVFSKSNPEVNETITISATIHNNGGDYAELNPINIGSQVNGANPATAGSYQRNHFPKNINDGDYSTAWASKYNSDWVKIDLTAIKSIKKIYWHDTFFVSDNQPGDFTIKVSTDDVSYTTIDSVTGYTGSSYTKILDTPVKARYIQMDITARAAGSAATLDELEVYEIYGTIIRFYDGDPDAGGTQIGSDQHLPPVPGSGTKTASVEWTATAEGIHNIYVVIDPDNLISESDDTNNKAYKTVAVGLPPDTTPPAAITDLTATTGTYPGEINLSWTAPGDDGTTGDIVGGKYRIQYSTDANVIWDKDNYDIEWSTNTFPGAHQAKTVTGLIQGTTYYFSIWTADEVPNWSSLSNSATSQSQVAILSISVSTDTYNFGEIPVSSGAVSITSVIVTNNGNVNQTYSLRCSTSNPGHLSPIVTSPGWDEFRLSTIFNSTATSGDFVQNDALTLESQTSSGSVFAKDEEGDQTGVNVPVDEDRNLWLKFESPWKTAETAEQEITITISAEMAE